MTAEASYAKQEKLDIGIVWAGNPNHTNDANRSCDLAVLRPIFELNDIRWISLQIGPRAAEIAANDLPIINLSGELTDFAITAAIVSQLDYVISVDTSVLHIAGALGISTCALIPFEPDWRWMLQRSIRLGIRASAFTAKRKGMTGHKQWKL